MMSSDADQLPKAATVVVMRDGPAGLQALMLRRNSKLAFYGGAWVFPGGRIDPDDRLPGAPHDDLAAARRAAVREAAEEAGLQLAIDELVHFAQWVTPKGRPRRFDTWFFTCVAQTDDVTIDRGEVDAHRWMTPEEALAGHGRGELELPPPTFVTLWQLRTFRNARSAYANLAAGPVQRYVPRPTPVDEGVVFLYEEDAGYEDRDPAARGPRHRITAHGTNWVYERPDDLRATLAANQGRKQEQSK